MDAELEFLKTALPQDWADYPRALMEGYAAHARMLRRTVPWCAALSREAYEQYVLCPRVNDEDLSDHRSLFYGELWPRVEGLDEEEAVLEVNRWCHEHASYQAQDDRTASPLTVYRCGSGRCGEESAFLVAALRSVGLPARQVYAPRWSHCDDNHAWVEALCHGEWRFLGACEPEPVLDRGWFCTAASRAMLVHSRTFGPVSDLALHGAPLDRRGQALYHDQTARYAQTKIHTFRAAPGEKVRLAILNEARFCPVAELTADERGLAEVELGLGDIHVDRGPEPCQGWAPFDFHAPLGDPAGPPPLTADQRRARAEVLERGNELRRTRLAGFFDLQRAARHPGQEALLRAARGNFDEICTFLDRDDDPLRAELLSTLADKDLRDAKAEVLEAHLERARPWAGRYPAEIFRRFLLCPRVAFERLGDWSAPQPGPVGEVIALRKMGTPAYLRPLDGAVMMWQNGKFVPKTPEGCGKVTFWKERGEKFLYRQNWSLARWTGTEWQELRLVDRAWRKDRLYASLPAGHYRVLTSLRLPAGDQLANRLEFDLAAGQALDISLQLRSCDLEDMICFRELPLEEVRPKNGKPALLLWLEEGAEPTEHILNELRAAQADFQALPMELTFFLRRPGAEEQATLASLLAGWPGIRLEWPDWGYQVEAVARHLGLDPDEPPLAVVCDKEGRAAYACCGYRVGTADLLRRIAEALL